MMTIWKEERMTLGAQLTPSVIPGNQPPQCNPEKEEKLVCTPPLVVLGPHVGLMASPDSLLCRDGAMDEGGQR